MNAKYLYIVAAILALCAAAVTMVAAAPGENVLPRVGFLAVAGLVLLYLGLRNRNASAG